MKKKLLAIILTLGSLSAQAQVRFDHQLSWSQLKAKAKTENKYIFVDFMATWCGPCRSMENAVYPNTILGEFVQARFLAIKVQTDQTAKDDEYTKMWYSDARQLSAELSVTALPTLMVFNPEGEPVARMAGYQEADALMYFLKEALDPGKQYNHLLNQYFAGKRAPAFLETLAIQAEKMGRAVMARKILGIDELSVMGKIPPFKPKLDFSGYWVLDTTQTNFGNLPKNVMCTSLSVKQGTSGIHLSRTTRGRSGELIQSTIDLNFSGTPESILLKSSQRNKTVVLYPGDDQSLVEYAEYSFLNRLELEYIVKDIWDLSADGKILTISRLVRDNGSGYTIRGIYNRQLL
ncbi:thioredoxin family protein [Mucilaginibacter dorajii]|uniref:Thioredoxin domain-containing protein n=1 Tax=Mucilaginibacter dorajii TaxID=692994 RepID=A0ABP7Q533_9SPHI|nr:thioredoxin family protein [Mucilaginibacter dorajii]MCS3732591.1 thiol-disulfide isomerase/thioredoxin [Mucilaginibacter dorajii]